MERIVFCGEEVLLAPEMTFVIPSTTSFFFLIMSRQEEEGTFFDKCLFSWLVRAGLVQFIRIKMLSGIRTLSVK